MHSTLEVTADDPFNFDVDGDLEFEEGELEQLKLLDSYRENLVAATAGVPRRPDSIGDSDDSVDSTLDATT